VGPEKFRPFGGRGFRWVGGRHFYFFPISGRTSGFSHKKARKSVSEGGGNKKKVRKGKKIGRRGGFRGAWGHCPRKKGTGGEKKKYNKKKKKTRPKAFPGGPLAWVHSLCSGVAGEFWGGLFLRGGVDGNYGVAQGNFIVEPRTFWGWFAGLGTQFFRRDFFGEPAWGGGDASAGGHLGPPWPFFSLVPVCNN